MTAAALDADLGDALAAGLLGAVPPDLAAFESAFVCEVEASGPDPEAAWNGFYDATLARVAAGWAQPPAGSGTVATFTSIWAHAAGLSRGSSALDVGTCFGFFPLAWSVLPASPRLFAVDVSAASAALAARQAIRQPVWRSRRVQVACADGRALPFRDRAVGTAHLLHVLEHVSAEIAADLLREALRVADHRVVVAVPVERTPDPVFGHVQVFDLARLAVLGRATGWDVSLRTLAGAWLVLDRP